MNFLPRTTSLAGLIGCLFLAIVQLPPLLVMIPVIVYVFANADTFPAVVFMIWSVLASASDTVLKPLLLGRGVEVPMLVVLLGAIGGMLHSGVIGLFSGAVVLTLGYRLFLAWLGIGAATNAVRDATNSPAGAPMLANGSAAHPTGEPTSREF